MTALNLRYACRKCGPCHDSSLAQVCRFGLIDLYSVSGQMRWVAEPRYLKGIHNLKCGFIPVPVYRFRDAIAKYIFAFENGSPGAEGAFVRA